MKILIEDMGEQVGYFVHYVDKFNTILCRYFSNIDDAYDMANAANIKFNYPIRLDIKW